MFGFGENLGGIPKKENQCMHFIHSFPFLNQIFEAKTEQHAIKVTTDQRNHRDNDDHDDDGDIETDLEVLALSFVLGSLGEIGDHAKPSGRILDDRDCGSPSHQGLVGGTFGFHVEVLPQILLHFLSHCRFLVNMRWLCSLVLDFFDYDELSSGKNIIYKKSYYFFCYGKLQNEAGNGGNVGVLRGKS